MNKVFLKGRIATDPIQRFIKDEISATRFVVAVNRPFSKDKEQKADFINVVAWNKQGEFVKKYFSKGQEIIIAGRLESNQYVDKETQKKLTSYQVVTEEIEFCGNRKEKEKEEEITEESLTENQTINFNELYGDDEELPF